MGNSLHNKIYLGRHSALTSRKLRVLLALGALVGVAVAWMAIRGFK
ncbi:hypothetical protein Q4S45_05440 [Massilia sp. R2A-15]|nr:hypothetical protein [Massilia sp. R2A-15]WLI90566.1 hypothetical protein Q4S45_05440 [Massilia sp. R2A-15]